MKNFLYYCLRFIGFVLIVSILDNYKQTYGWVSFVVAIIIGGIGDGLLRKQFRVDDK